MSTLTYYNQNASAFTSDTAELQFTQVQDRFLALIPAGGKLLDFGCGSGRDTRYFLSKGYDVEACDGSREMCKAASELTGIPVRQLLFHELDAQNRYDGLWACASILHLPKDELGEVFKRMLRAVKKGGIIYTSFKYGDFQGYRGERYYTDFTEESFRDFAGHFPQLTIEDLWLSADVRPGRSEEMWVNLLMRSKA